MEAELNIYQDLEKIIRHSAFDPTSVTAANVLADGGAPSMSIAIMDEGNISSYCISTQCNNTDSLFQACSISKAVAGVAVMKLIELGHFALDDKACDLLPAEIVALMAKDPRTETLLRQVTIKHLMSHTSGLSVHGFPGYPDPENVPSLYQILEGRKAANSEPIRMLTLPGLEFMYSGGGITVLQCVVENVMKCSFEEVMKTFVLEPLSMTRSFYQLPLNEDNIAYANYHGYYRTENKWHTLPEQAAAGLWTTPADLLKVVHAVQESLSGTKKNTILKQETAKTMLTSIKDAALTWFVDPFAFQHSGGNIPGYQTFVFGYADLSDHEKLKDNKKYSNLVIPHNCGISVMTNSAVGVNQFSRVMDAIAYLKGWIACPNVAHDDSFAIVPFPALKNADNHSSWKDWISDSWSDGWLVRENEQGDPIAGIDPKGLMKLKPAALSPKSYDGGKKSIDLVMDGFRIMLRLGWDDSERIIEVWNGGTQKKKTVRKEQK